MSYLPKYDNKRWPDLSEINLMLTQIIQEWRTRWVKENLSKGWGYPCQTALQGSAQVNRAEVTVPQGLKKWAYSASKEHLKHSKNQAVHLKDVVWKTNSPYIRSNTYKALSFWPRHLRSYRSGGSGRVKQHHSGWLIISMNFYPLQSGFFSLKPL